MIAGAGVSIMTFIYGQFPWISVYLACTWGLYGLLRKKSPLNAVEGLTLETAALSIPVIIYLAYLQMAGATSFFMNLPTSLLLVCSGLISGLPLIIFIIGARIVDLSTLGIVQYIYPILIFLIGVLLYDEPLIESRIIGLIFIWIALLVYIVEGALFFKRNRISVSPN